MFFSTQFSSSLLVASSSFFQIIMNESGNGVIKHHPNEDIPGLDLGQSCHRSKATFGFIFQAHRSPLRAGFPHTGVWTEGPCRIWEFILFLPVHRKFNIYTQVCASKGESLFPVSVSMTLTKTILKPALGTEQIPGMIPGICAVNTSAGKKTLIL